MLTIKISSCEICKSMKNQRLSEKLAKAFPQAQIQMKCQSYCGPGSRQPFVMINDDIITAQTVDMLIKEIEKYLSK